MSTATNLERWHQVVSNKDFDLLNELLDENVEFHSPTLWAPKKGIMVTAFILQTVIGIFEDFQYHREFTNEQDCALEFSATVNGKKLKGIDLIHWNDEGKITLFEVMVRPMNGVQNLYDRMTEELQKAGLIPKT